MKKRASSTKTLLPGFRIVALGGGTGLSVLLRGLKEHVVRRPDELATAERPISDLAAIVTVTDDGGSSGRLRRENCILPPGDIRNCMVALSKDEALMGRLFQYRFHVGPGSLYTSVLPNLLIPEIAAATARSKAPRVYIANLMTQPGETTGYGLADHVCAIQKHVPRRVIDYVVANRQAVSTEVVRRYRAEGAAPVAVDLPALQNLGCRVILDNLVEEHGVLRHNSKRLSRLLLEQFLPRS